MRRRLNQAFLSSSHPCGWGPNKENFIKKCYKQSKLGSGPSKENFIKKFYKLSKLGADDEFQKHSVPLP
ncbi:hypothetical protein BUZ28_08300 [Staphylococcus borealis]|nr:hypothetical protein BUZ28_08300 [Staphylococcus borealis]RIO70811.1 hypothetical protein BUZ17_05880 [Staphylococcus borealis]